MYYTIIYKLHIYALSDMHILDVLPFTMLQNMM